MKKIAVLGKGKTGSEVIKLLGTRLHAVFDRTHPVTVAGLQGADAIIIFIPGSQVAEILPLIKEAKIPAVWGSTGFEWPVDLDDELNDDHIQWVVSANFSLGMQVLRRTLQGLGRDLPRLLPDAKCSLQEIHHAQKQDAPSGTALAWQQWLGLPCEIHSERTGDVKGIHELNIETGAERITLRHEAKDRSIFAEGAIWAADYLLGYPTLPGGLYQLSDLIDQEGER